jgi:hypothetical protein
MAGAASRVLSYLFPEHPEPRFAALAEEAAQSRLWAGANFRSDVESGLTLGRKVADHVIARATTDGSERMWDGRRPQGRGYWTPPPGTVAAAVEPTAGQWRTWVLASGSQLDPGPPPEYGSPRFMAEAREVADAVRGLRTPFETSGSTLRSSPSCPPPSFRPTCRGTPPTPVRRAKCWPTCSPSGQRPSRPWPTRRPRPASTPASTTAATTTQAWRWGGGWARWRWSAPGETELAVRPRAEPRTVVAEAVARFPPPD